MNLEEIIKQIEYLKQEIKLQELELKKQNDMIDKYNSIINGATSNLLENVNYCENKVTKIAKLEQELNILKKRLKKELILVISSLVVLLGISIIDLSSISTILKVITSSSSIVVGFLSVFDIKQILEKKNLLKNNTLESAKEELNIAKEKLNEKKETLKPILSKRQSLSEENKNLCTSMIKNKGKLSSLVRQKNKMYDEYRNNIEEEISMNIKTIDNQITIDEYLNQGKTRVKKKNNM